MIKKIFPTTIFSLCMLAGFGQDATKSAAEKLAAKLKESTELALQVKLNSKMDQPDLKRVGSKASAGQAQIDFNRLILTAENATRSDLREIVRFDAGTLNMTFSLSGAFAGIATNMAILEPKEAEKVNLAVIKANNTWKYISGGLAAAGTAFTVAQLVGNSNSVSPRTTLTINMASLVPLLINSFGKSGNTGNAEVSEKINSAISSAATYAYQKGQRLAVHSFLSVEISKVTGKLESLRAQASDITAKVQQTQTDAELLALASALTALIDETDTFFSSTILNMQVAIKEHSTIELYDQNTQNRLAGLAGQITVAIASWENMKVQYKKHQNLIINAVSVLQ